MGIIHIHIPMGIVINTLQTTRYGRNGIYSGFKIVGRQIQRGSDADRTKNIFQVVLTDKRRFKIKFSAGRCNFSRNTAQVTLCACGSNRIIGP